jgi:hypothetical protein
MKHRVQRVFLLPRFKIRRRIGMLMAFVRDSTVLSGPFWVNMQYILLNWTATLWKFDSLLRLIFARMAFSQRNLLQVVSLLQSSGSISLSLLSNRSWRLRFMTKSSFGITCKKTASESWRCSSLGEFSRSHVSLLKRKQSGGFCAISTNSCAS